MRSSNTRAIEAFAPDVVLAEHFRVPKLTAFPTLGLMWSPPTLMGEQDHFFKNSISYDGWLFSDEATQRFHLDLAAPLCTRHVLGRWFPSCQETVLSNQPRSGIAYLATGWDGDRHGNLIAEIKKRCDLRFYGPERGASEVNMPKPISLPFDGTGVIAELSGRVASICLHSDAHRRNGSPSAREFEAAAAGAIIISDENSFIRNTFGDAALYLDVEASATDAAESVACHLAWLASHPDDAERMRATAHRIFVEQFSFEVLLRQLPGLVEEVRKAWRPSDRCASQSVAFIVRTGERDLAFLDRALGSLERQTHKNIHAVVVAYRNIAAVRRWVEHRRPKIASVEVVESRDSGMRSTSLWTGLAHVKTDFFGVLDDDDTIMPDHIAACLGTLDAHSEMDVAFGGSILVNEHAPDEPRSVFYFYRFDVEQFCAGNFITSNAWLARASVLARIGDDPMLAVVEDYYLLFRCLRGSNFIPTWRLTSEHYSRSDDPTNSERLGGEVNAQSMERIRHRTYFGVVQQGRVALRPLPYLFKKKRRRDKRKEWALWITAGGAVVAAVATVANWLHSK